MNVTIVIPRQSESMFQISVMAIVDESLAEGIHQDLVYYQVPKSLMSGQLYNISLVDFIFNDGEDTISFVLKACYEELCNETVIFIMDNDRKHCLMAEMPCKA